MNKQHLEKYSFFKKKDLTYSIDSLTKVLNRDTIFAFAQDLQRQQIPFTMITCDIDNFKYVNDTYGHLIGDKVLVKSCENFMQIIDEYGVIGRFGGDEFIVVVPEMEIYEDIWKLCRQINLSTNSLHLEELQGACITYTMGTVRYPLDGTDMKTLIQKSDKALYRGKQKGRNCFVIYRADKHDSIEIGDSGKIIFSSMDMHCRIINTLTHTGNLADNVRTLLNFLSNSLMLDHICIQSFTQMCASVIYPLSVVQSFSMFPTDIMESLVNTNGFYNINNRNNLLKFESTQFHDCMQTHQIWGCFFVKIEAFGKVYGFLRADSTSDNGRLWQNTEMDLLIVFAKTLAVLLHANNTDLDTLF